MARAALPLSVLLVYGAAFASRALGRGVLVFDDHPGQLYRAWHVVANGWMPWAWNAGWWAGYPELQFYPPLYSWLVAAPHVASVGALPLGAAYQAMLWLTYLAPGIAVFALLARRLGDPWLALPGALVALTLSAGLATGVDGGVRTGMAPARLAWAALPLLALALDGWTAGERRLRVVTVAVLLAAIVLMHPAIAPTAAAALAIAATVRQPRAPRLRAAAAALGLAFVLTAVWTVPLLARLAHTRALAWGSLSATGFAASLFRDPLLLAVVVLAAAAPWLARSPADTALARLPWVAAGIVAADALVLEPLGARWLPADRVADGAWMAALIAASVAAGRLLQRLPRVPTPAAASGAAVAALALGAAAGSLTLWPRAADWPTLSETTRGLRLQTLWTTLARAPEGRALFVRAAVPLAYGTHWWRPHTHVASLAPMLADRPIVNATFTHPAPVAALLYRGSAGPGAITSLVERHDGRTLLGRPLERLDAAALDALTERLGVSVVVALDEDMPRLGGIVEGLRQTAVGPFVVLDRAQDTAIPRRVGGDHWRLTLQTRDGGWTSARLAYYPLWRAEVDGRLMQTRRGDDGMLEVRLPADVPLTVDLVYRPAAPEYAGAALTLLGAVGIAAARLGRRRRAKS